MKLSKMALIPLFLVGAALAASALPILTSGWTLGANLGSGQGPLYNPPQFPISGPGTLTNTGPGGRIAFVNSAGRLFPIKVGGSKVLTASDTGNVIDLAEATGPQVGSQGTYP